MTQTFYLHVSRGEVGQTSLQLTVYKMNKKTLGIGLTALSLGAVLITPTADAFWGGNGNGVNSQEKFVEMQQMMQSFSSWEDFNKAMTEKRESRKAERSTMRDQISHEAKKIENGVVITITTDNAEALEKMQKRHENRANRDGKFRENVSRSEETLENGFRITMTTEDSDTLTRLHERADNGWKMGKRRGGQRGHGNRNGRRGSGQQGGGGMRW